MRFIATADWQLGMAAGFLVDEGARLLFQRARFDAIARIGQLARERDAAFIVVGGDVFESNQLDRGILLRTFEVLRSIDVPVVLLPGNHDPLDAASIYDSPDFAKRVPDNVVVLRDSNPVEVVRGVEVVGAPWFSKRPTSDLVADALGALEPAPDGVTRILVGHGDAMVGISGDGESVLTIDTTAVQAALDDGRIAFAVVGDRHSTTEVAPRIWYPGTPEVTRRTETDPGNALVVDSDSGEVDVVHVGEWKFVLPEAELGSREDVDAFLAELGAIEAKERTVVRYILRGGLGMADRAYLEDELETLVPLFASLEPWKRHMDLVTVPEDGDFGNLGLSAFAESAVEELMGLARSDSEGARTAQDALTLLYRFVGGVR